MKPAWGDSVASSSYLATLARRTRSAAPVLMPPRIPMRGWEGVWPENASVTDATTDAVARAEPQRHLGASAPVVTRLPPSPTAAGLQSAPARGEAEPDAPPAVAVAPPAPQVAPEGERRRRSVPPPYQPSLASPEPLVSPTPLATTSRAMPSIPPARTPAPLASPSPAPPPTAPAAMPVAPTVAAEPAPPPIQPQPVRRQARRVVDAEMRPDTMSATAVRDATPVTAGPVTPNSVPAAPRPQPRGDNPGAEEGRPQPLRPVDHGRPQSRARPDPREPAPVPRPAHPPSLAAALHAAFEWVGQPPPTARRDPPRSDPGQPWPAAPRSAVPDTVTRPVDPVPRPASPLLADRRFPPASQARTLHIGSIEVRVEPPVPPPVPVPRDRPAPTVQTAPPTPPVGLARGFTTSLGLRQE
jgi:hypothetical protein